MTISLAGAAGTDSGAQPGVGQRVQQAVPDPVKPKNDAPPALAKPEMVEPVKAAEAGAEGDREAGAKNASRSCTAARRRRARK